MRTAKEVTYTVKKTNKTRRGPGFVPMLVLLVLIAVVGVELVKMAGDIKAGQNSQSTLEARKLQLTQENETMRSDLEKADDPAFMLEKAREEADYVFPNERIFIDINGVGD